MAREISRLYRELAEVPAYTSAYFLKSGTAHSSWYPSCLFTYYSNMYPSIYSHKDNYIRSRSSAQCQAYRQQAHRINAFRCRCHLISRRFCTSLCALPIREETGRLTRDLRRIFEEKICRGLARQSSRSDEGSDQDP